MALKYDSLLKKLGITQWTLRLPRVLKGEALINLSPEISLLTVAEVVPDSRDTLFCDVLRSLRLTPEQTYNLTPNQVARLPVNIECNSWRLGIMDPLTIAGAQLYSPVLSELAQDHCSKRALWKQIYHYEKYFYSDGP